jgi:hypothetical protein
MASLSGFDASQVPDGPERGAIPEGQYVVIAVASEMKPTKTGTGQYLQITFEVLDGPRKGAKIWSRLNLMNANQTAVDIAKRELADICKAVGVIRPNDSAELHNKPLLATVVVEVDDRRRENNSISKYEALNGGAPGATFAAPPAAAPVAMPFAMAGQQQQPQQPQQPAPGVAAGTNPAAPWAR